MMEQQEKLQALFNTPRMGHVWDGRLPLDPRNSVEGLYEMVNKYFKQDFVMVEIGSFQGTSTMLFSMFCKKVYSVDCYDYPVPPSGRIPSHDQTFIDAVRSTGGKNAYRTLVVQGPDTDIEKTNKLMLTLPTDKVANRMMMEVHYYTPYQFTLMDKDADWGKMFYYWGANTRSTTDTERNPTWGEEADLAKLFKSMKTQFVDKGIPVILGEFGAIRRSNLSGSNLSLHLASRAYYLKMVVQQAKANGMVPFYWDEGNLGSNGFGIFNRFNTSVADTQALNGLLDGFN